MLPLTLGPLRGRRLTLLCVGAHADDIEIGCGGTVLRVLAENARVTVHWVVFSAAGARAAEARRSAARFTRRAAARHVRIEGFRDGYLPCEGGAVKDVFEELKAAVHPDLVFTHHRRDAHQDHRLVSALTWNTFRRHCILEYEVPKYDGDLGTPNVFVPLAAGIRRQKVRALMAGFPSQRRKRWFSEATFDGLMRLRGVESGAAEGYAEAFYGRKVVLDPAPRRR